MGHSYGWSAPILSALLEQILEDYRIDTDRIHLTGFSMGGYGVWDLAQHEPHRFASLMPICGGADPAIASSLSHLPTWIHRGKGDDIIPAEASKMMYDALIASRAGEVHFSCHENTKHDA